MLSPYSLPLTARRHLPSVIVMASPIASVASNESYQETPSGYDCELFVINPPHERYLCEICKMVIRDAYLITACGHYFCLNCLTRWLENNDTCPSCREEDTNHVQNRGLDREINNLEIHCPNDEKNKEGTSHKEGCRWRGELRGLQNHLDVCDYEKVNCTNKGCKVKMKRKQLAKHLKKNCCYRLVQCEYCHLDVPSWIITGQISKSSQIPDLTPGAHYSVCSEYPLACPNRCGVTGIRRRAMPDHRSFCPLDPLDCLFKDAGCTEKIARKDMDDHMTKYQQKHMLQGYQSLKRCNERIYKDLHTTRDELNDTKHKLDATKEVLHDTQEQLDRVKRELLHAKQDLQVTKEHLADTRGHLLTIHRDLYYTKQRLITATVGLSLIGPKLIFRLSSISQLMNHNKVWKSLPFSIEDKIRVHLEVYPSRVESNQLSLVTLSVSLVLKEVLKIPLKKSSLLLTYDVLVTAMGTNIKHSIVLCTIQSSKELDFETLSTLCSASFPFPLPGEKLQSVQLILNANSLLNDSIILELKLLKHEHRL